MKRLLILSLLACTALTARATVTYNLGAGTLYNSNGSSPVANGMLVQLLASTADATFSTPIGGSFTGNSTDDVVLFSFSINAGFGTPGSVLTALIVNFANYPGLSLGDPLLLRWFPTIAGPAGPTVGAVGSPTAGASFGQFRTDIVEANNFSNTNWITTADAGQTFDLNFLTMSQNAASTHPESDGFANMLVAVPEPSTFALLGFSVVGLVGYARRRKS